MKAYTVCSVPCSQLGERTLMQGTRKNWLKATSLLEKGTSWRSTWSPQDCLYASAALVSIIGPILEQRKLFLVVSS